MKNNKRLVAVYVRINGVEKYAVDGSLVPDQERNGGKRGLVENREFHEALGLKVGGVR